MKFGYFTLSDNRYENNTRNANRFVADIIDEAVYAEEVGLHSAWIGEHHFSTLGVLSCPDLVLANVAARTRHLRLAPAVTVLPLHHPIRVAEQWATLDLLSGGRVDFAAGRGYDRQEYRPFGVSFEDNQAIFEEGMEIVRRLWSADGPISHTGKHYQFENVAITPSPKTTTEPAAEVAGSTPETGAESLGDIARRYRALQQAHQKPGPQPTAPQLKIGGQALAYPTFSPPLARTAVPPAPPRFLKPTRERARRSMPR